MARPVGRSAPQGLPRTGGSCTSRPLRPSRTGVHAVCPVAVRRPLGDLPLHRLEGGRCLVPLLQPSHDELPFAMALELYSGHTEQPESSFPKRLHAGSEELYQLHYILDGCGQVVGQDGQRERLAAGDSVLMPLGGAALQACDTMHSIDGSSEGDDVVPAHYDMAALVLLIPKELLQRPEGGQYVDATEVVSATEAWQAAPAVGRLSDQQATDIMLNARNSAYKAMAQHAHTSDPPSLGFVPAAPGDEGAGSCPEAAPQPVAGAALDSLPAAVSGSEGALRRTRQHRQQSGNAMLEAAQTAAQGIFSHFLRRLRPSSAASSSARPQDSNSLECPAGVLKRTLHELNAFRLPNQTNRLALVFEPGDDPVPFTFGVEIFEPGHRTAPHTHQTAHELFFILAGEGVAFCDGERFPVKAGDSIVFPPTSVHGIDNGDAAKMYCLELMLPNEMFAEFVKGGQEAGALDDEDLCVMIAVGCGSAQPAVGVS